MTFYKKVDATEGHPLELMCKTGLPIRFCRYISPNGDSYHLENKRNSKLYVISDIKRVYFWLPLMFVVYSIVAED